MSNNSVMNMLILATCTLLFAQSQAQYNSYQGTNYNIGDQSRQEVIDANGNIRGQYSYVDPNGKSVIVRYTAGENGFQVENGPTAILRPASVPQPQPQTLQPGVSYRGLQIGRPRYLGQLFQPAPASSQPAYTTKQLENYQKSLVEQNNQLSDVTPAQFPSNAAVSPQPFVGAPLPASGPTQFQQIQFLPQNSGLNIPPLLQPTNNLNSGNALQYGAGAPSVLFQSNGNPNLREIAQNPIPPEFKAPPPTRIATPITEEGEDGALYDISRDSRYVNFNY